MSFKIFLFFFQLFYGIISIGAYILILYILIKNWKDFQSTYFKFFIIDFFVNICSFIDSYFVSRLPGITCETCLLAPWFSPNSIIPVRITLFLNTSLVQTQYFMILMTSLNRLTMLLKPHSFEKFWKPTWFLLVIIALCFPLIPHYDILIHPAYYVYQLEIFHSWTEIDHPRMMRISLIIQIVFMILTTIVNVASIIQLNTMKYRIDKAERNFFFVSFCSFVVQLIGTINSLIMQFGTSSGIYSVFWDWSRAFRPYATDSICLLPPWILLFFSKNIRTLVKELLSIPSARFFVQASGTRSM